MNHPMHSKQRSRGRGPSHGGGGGGGGGASAVSNPGGGGGGNGARNNRHLNVRGQVFDSNGPEGRIRGNAHQVMEKYLAMARDASSQGDRVAAENYYQHAEHYFRLINAHSQSNGQRRPAHLSTPAEDQNEMSEGDEDGEGQQDESEAAQGAGDDTSSEAASA